MVCIRTDSMDEMIMARGKKDTSGGSHAASPTQQSKCDVTVSGGYDPTAETHYRVVAFEKPGNVSAEAILSVETLAAGERSVLLALGRAGLPVPIERSRRTALIQAIDAPSTANTLEIHSRVGWCKSEKAGSEDIYVTPLMVYGGRSDIRLDLERVMGNHHFAAAGTLQEWIEHVAALADGNRLLVFCLALAFVGPILRLLEAESFGVQLFNTTSLGKSITAMMAGSVWGGGGPLGFGQSWMTTANALDRTALAHNDAFLVLDETGLAEGEGSANSSLVPKSAYRLVNGMEKARATDQARRGSWRIVFLSTSEYSLADLASHAGIRLHGGQMVRLIDIPADGGQNMGIFEEIHGAPDSEVFADTMKASACRYYGTASQRFLARLVEEVTEDAAGLKAWLHGRVNKYLDRASALRGASGPTMRVANHFASIFAAGCLASRYGVLPFKPAEIGRAVFRTHELVDLSRLATLPSTPPRPTDLVAIAAKSIRAARKAFLDIATVKSLDKDEWEAAAGGVKRKGGDVTYLFSSSAFRKICGSADPHSVKRALQATGFLVTYKDGKKGIVQQFPEPLGRIRVTAICGSILNYRK